MRDLPALQKTLEEYAEARKSAGDQAAAIYASSKRLAEYLGEFGPYLMPGNLAPRYSIDRVVRDLDRAFWRRAFDLTGFSKLMDYEAKNKFERDLENDPPEFTMENIKTTFLALFQDADEMFNRGIVNVFKQLSPDFKRHDCFKVAEKIILQYTCDSFYDYPFIHYGKGQIINDVDRVFKILDSQQHNSRELESALNTHWKANGHGSVYEDDYYQVKAYKNGNTHWKFKRLDLLEKVNELIAEHYADNSLGCDH